MTSPLQKFRSCLLAAMIAAAVTLPCGWWLETTARQQATQARSAAIAAEEQAAAAVFAEEIAAEILLPPISSKRIDYRGYKSQADELERIEQRRRFTFGRMSRGAPLRFGPSPDWEAALYAACGWLVSHQAPDGSWNFDHRQKTCPVDCTCAGTATDCRTGATALALMTLLGGGQTHWEGMYKENVTAGVNFLLRQMEVAHPADGSPPQGTLSQPGMSAAHALATIALCEDFGLTQDLALEEPPQLALNEIIARQNANGGWDSERGESDITLSAWNMLALEHGKLSGFRVPPGTVKRAEAFFASSPASINHPDAAPLLRSRILLRPMWNDPELLRDVKALHGSGIALDNLTYDYFATQVMQDYGGQEGNEWRENMKDWLVKTQERKGHDRGTWHFPNDPDSEAGGRMYCTALAMLILELRMRVLPGASRDDFPL